MKYRLVTLIATLIMNFFGFAQKNLFTLLNKDTNYIIIKPIEKQNKLIHIPQDLDCEPARHNYIVKNKQLFAQLDGSGKIFVVDSNSIVKRIDKTCFEGYNFYSYSFSWQNKVYNLGGWGFWKYDGGLRYFNEEAQEWFIEPINIKVPFAQYLNASVWHDIKDAKIYVVFKNDQDAYLKNNPQLKDSIFVQCFNIKSFSWWPKSKPLITENPIQELNGIYKSIPTHLGLLTETNKGYYLYNFRQNSVERLSEEKAAIVSALINKNQTGFYIISESDCKFYNPINDSVSHLNISEKDFIAKKGNIYKDPIQITESWNWNYIKGFLILLLLTAILIFRKREQKLKRVIQRIQGSSKIKNKQELDVIDKSKHFDDVLTIQEKDVLHLLVSNTINKSFTSVDEINNILGTKNKDSAIQKNIRAEVLSGLNEKFQVYAGTKDQLIERERTQFDKRVYHYRINENYLNKVSSRR